MIKTAISIFSLILFTSCFSEIKNNKIIFDAHSSKEFIIIGHQELNDGVIWITDTSDVHNSPVFQLNGQWDMSEKNHIKLVLINGSDYENLNVTFRIEGEGQFAGGGNLYSKKSLSGGETVEWMIPLHSGPQYPEILNEMSGMREIPFNIDGVTSTLNLKENISRIFISFDKSLKGTKLGIKQISIGTGSKVITPGWFKLSKKDFFPFIDKYGQFIHKNWEGKTLKDSDLLHDLNIELAKLEYNRNYQKVSKYGGWLEGKRHKATGNFYLSKVDGKWWMIDPDGYLFWSHGVVRVTPSSAVTIIDDREHYFEVLPDRSSPYGEFYKTKDEFLYKYYKSREKNRTYDFSASNLKLKYGEEWRSSYTTMVTKRLNSWGINTISAGSDPKIYQAANIPYCDRIELISPRIDGAPAKLNVVRDPFDTEFKTQLIKQLQDRKKELRSEWCYGYFIDNKLVWGANYDIGRWVLKSSSKQPAKQTFIKNLKSKYKDIDVLNDAWNVNYTSWNEVLLKNDEPSEKSLKDCAEFSSILIEKYFKNVKEVIKDVAPSKLYLGCRYVSINENVLRIAAKYSDVLTFDLFVDSLSDFKLPEGIDKPVIIGEFHFGALDRGLFNAGLNKKANQKERGLAYEKYVKSALKNPQIIGTSWHQFSDQATTGRFDGENFQDGLTDVCDRVYEETVLKVQEVGHNIYHIRANMFK